MWMINITINIDNFLINDRLNDLQIREYHNFYMGYIMRLVKNNFYHK